MKKIFLDTNVILDDVLERKGARETQQLYTRADRGQIKLYTSFLSMANVAYILRKMPNESLIELLKGITSFVEILSMDDKQFFSSLEANAPDFEDSLQYQCAKVHNCDFLLTNNVKHFKFSKIPVITPTEFLATFTNSCSDNMQKRRANDASKEQ